MRDDVNVLGLVAKGQRGYLTGVDPTKNERKSRRV